MCFTTNCAAVFCRLYQGILLIKPETNKINRDKQNRQPQCSLRTSGLPVFYTIENIFNIPLYKSSYS